MFEKMTIHRQHKRNVVAKMETKPEFLVAKGEMLVALATVSVAISIPVSLCRNF